MNKKQRISIIWIWIILLVLILFVCVCNEIIDPGDPSLRIKEERWKE